MPRRSVFRRADYAREGEPAYVSGSFIAVAAAIRRAEIAQGRSKESAMFSSPAIILFRVNKVSLCDGDVSGIGWRMMMRRQSARRLDVDMRCRLCALRATYGAAHGATAAECGARSILGFVDDEP